MIVGLKTIGGYYKSIFDHTLSSGALFAFFIFTIAVVSVLLNYYNLISKINHTLNKKSKAVNLPLFRVKLTAFSICISLILVPFEQLMEYSEALIIASLILSVLYLKYLQKGSKIIVKKEKVDHNELEFPIYKSNKDVLLQSNSEEGTYLTVSETNSTIIKLVALVITVIVIVTPLFKLLGISSF